MKKAGRKSGNRIMEAVCTASFLWETGMKKPRQIMPGLFSEGVKMRKGKKKEDSCLRTEGKRRRRSKGEGDSTFVVNSIAPKCGKNMLKIGKQCVERMTGVPDRYKAHEAIVYLARLC